MDDNQGGRSVESSHERSSSFQAMEALEILHAQLMRTETLTRAACEAADQLRPPAARGAKRDLIRVQILAGQAAAEARAAVASSDRLVAGLRRRRRRASSVQAQPGGQRSEASSPAKE